MCLFCPFFVVVVVLVVILVFFSENFIKLLFSPAVSLHPIMTPFNGL